MPGVILDKDQKIIASQNPIQFIPFERQFFEIEDFERKLKDQSDDCNSGHSQWIRRPSSQGRPGQLQPQPRTRLNQFRC